MFVSLFLKTYARFTVNGATFFSLKLNSDFDLIRRHSTTVPSIRDNRLTYQRKYDNAIFRHDLPDRIVLPPLPV